MALLRTSSCSFFFILLLICLYLPTFTAAEIHPQTTLSRPPCILCGWALNSIEGFMLENLTETQMISYFKDDLCNQVSAELQLFCDALVEELPLILDAVADHQSIDSICQQLKLCKVPEPHLKDLTPLDVVVVDLDLDPVDRWSDALSNPRYRVLYQDFLADLYKVAPAAIADLIEVGGVIADDFPSPYKEEMVGVSKALNVSTGVVALVNIAYEISDFCTSIVAKRKDGTILHARNLDFGMGMEFTQLLKNVSMTVHFTSNGEVVYTTITYAGFIGALTGMKPGGFAATINTRSPQKAPVWFLFREIVQKLRFHNSSINSFLLRDALSSLSSFDSAVSLLSSHPLITDVYYTVSGLSDGCVITRNASRAVDVWCIEANDVWYVLETNYDRWKSPPEFDNRRVPAEEGMDAMGADGVTLDGMLQVLSTKPVLNQLTTYSVIISAQNNTFQGWTRYCTPPCPS